MENYGFSNFQTSNNHLKTGLPKVPTYTHSYCSDNAVTLLNIAKSLKNQYITKMEIYLNFVCQPTSQLASLT